MKSGFEIISVSQLNFYVKSQLDGDPMLYNIFLRGEISNFTNHYRSGHLYMSLKDDKAVIKAVMFRSSASHLTFMPQDGMKVIVMGRASLYDRDGSFQFYIDDMQPDGVGALHIAFEQLKTKLAGEGLFDEERKKPIPRYPAKIGVITSPTGAAIQDICNVSSRRWPLAELVLYSVQVQGDKAPSQIVNAINYFELAKNVDVIIVGRGGGSIEDLWAFNDENVARTIANCSIPIISAVGHETDFTIADFVADLRAPTPSAAAELASPDKDEVIGNLSYLADTIKSLAGNRLSSEMQRLDTIVSKPVFLNPVNIVEPYRENLSDTVSKINSSVHGFIDNNRRALSEKSLRLDAMSPLKVLSRGYAIAANQEKTLTSIEELHKGDNITLTFHNGTAQCEVQNISKRPE